MTTPQSAQGGGSGETMAKGLQKILGDIAQMQASPDADVDFLMQLQQVIVGRIKQGTQQQPPGGPGGQPGMQGGPQQPPGQPSPAPMGGPAMGLSQTGNVGNMDELARVLGGASQAG